MTTDIPVSARGLLAEFAIAGVIGWADVHLAQTLGRATGETREQVLLAAALCLRAQRSGSVCLPLARAVLYAGEPDARAELVPHEAVVEPAWPGLDQWLAELAASPLVGVGLDAPANQRPLRLVDERLYLERNWSQEETVRLALRTRIAHTPPPVASDRLEAAIAAAFADSDPATSGAQRTAVATAMRTWTSVIAGGPGTGKTTTIAHLLAVADRLASNRVRVGLASFTGKAAARMQQSLAASLAAAGTDMSDWQHLLVAPATTLHSLLGARPGAGFSRDASHPLPHDMLIVDEMSMVSLDLMAALMTALRPTTRLVLVGDPHQLSSVDAGAVLADIVTAGLPADGDGSGSAITELDHYHRFSGPIQQLATAIRRADASAALDLAQAGHPEIEFVDCDPDPARITWFESLTADLVEQGRDLYAAGLAGDGAAALTALDAHRLLCAHRSGRYGVAWWMRAVESLLSQQVPGYARGDQWYPGRPVLVTRNSPELQVTNGDTGAVVLRDGQPQLALGSVGAPRFLSPWVLDALESMHALTVHKSQGSEYDRVTLVLPPTGSPLLTRELLYTALTRARSRVRILGRPEALVEAINTPARRATGLAQRLRHP